MQIRYLPCRDLRHSWEQTGDNILIEEKGQVKHFSRMLTCERCGTKRVDEYKMSRVSLARIRSSYQYPVGYQVRGGLSVADARLALFSNMSFRRKDDDEPGLPVLRSESGSSRDRSQV